MQQKKRRITIKSSHAVVDHEKIRRLREEMVLTLDEAARAAGMGSRVRWWELERGRIRDPRVSTLQLVARVLDVAVDELLAEPTRRSAAAGDEAT